MRVSATNKQNFCAVSKVATLKKNVVNRSALKQTKSNLKSLAGPEEVKKAKIVVAATVAENAAIAAAMSQMPGLDEAALAANETKMAMEIFNGIYKFDFSKTIVTSILTALLGNRIGTSIFKGATKLITWIPGPGNAVNATVSAGTTTALGASVIAIAEDMDRSRRRGQKMDDIIKRIEGKKK